MSDVAQTQNPLKFPLSGMQLRFYLALMDFLSTSHLIRLTLGVCDEYEAQQLK